ncbi:MAG TPA: hypothetical protein VF042_10755 [Gemmatimonadaceae bacterium]
MTKRFLSITLLALSAACSDKPQTAEDSAVAARARMDSIIGQSQVIAPEGDSVTAPAPSAPSTDERPAGEWEVTYSGMGTIRAGMSVDELKIVSRDQYSIPDKLDECAYVRPKTGHKGVSLMIIKGEVARVDITEGNTATVEGAKIGDSESRIKSLYGDRVKVMPHKYTSGHYLVVTPPSGGENRIVFETDGSKVTRYRAGREPEVEFVEGCS